MTKNRKKLICLWIVLLFMGLMITSYYRQKQFGGQIEENISNLEEIVKKNSDILEKDREFLEKGNLDDTFKYFQKKALFLYYIYFLDYNTYLQKEEKLFSWIFRTHARESALLETKSKILSAYLTVNEKWSCHVDISGTSGHAEEYCKILLKYYDDENYNSWNDFVISDRYNSVHSFAAMLYNSKVCNGRIW